MLAKSNYEEGFLNLCLKRMKNKQKEAGVGPFKNIWQIFGLILIVSKLNLTDNVELQNGITTTMNHL